MDGQSPDRNIVDWDEHDVHTWLSSMGFSQYEQQLNEHGITGEVLCLLNADSLKSVGVSTIGQRLAILKAVYQVKLAHNVPIDPDAYVPPSEASERLEGLTVEKLHGMIKDQATRLHHLEEENRHLNHTFQLFVEDFNAFRGSVGRSDETPSNSLRRQPSFKWAQYVRPAKSPTKPDIDSPHPSPQQLEHDVSYGRNQSQFSSASSSTPPEKSSRGTPPTDSPNLTTPLPPKTARTDSSETLKSFKVSLEDPTWKVLPAALKKYRINNDNWENYAMFICYGSTGNRIERCLSYDEKPLLLFQKLKDAKKNPVFMLKHIKDIRSPIVVAQQKHAARKASSIMTNGSATTSSATLGHAGRTPSTSTTRGLRPSKLEVDLNTSTGAPATGISPAPGWPDGLMSPSGERADDPMGSSTHHLSASTTMTGSTLVTNSNGGHDSLKRSNGDPTDVTPNTAREMPPLSSSGVSYAVAIYPYMAEQEDEFDVVVGDTFIILSRARGWWVVQRDPTGSGIVDTDLVKQGWVPAGCLLETNVPVASAIAEATAAKGSSSSSSDSDSPPETPVSKTPILPLSIISTSFPGVALMDYKKKGDEELDLVKDDALRVFKRYNHWSYAVKEEGGDRGWVPSWFIGKVATGPATPMTSVPPTTSSLMDDTSQAQVSPMSSAFPAVQPSSRSVAVN
ncbi:hypothetical protein C8F04DRAFT_1097874 [Mycena alexandri]|uniref:Protein kinase regulator n=1 Tax=Mycena alexandri TaxID=1745969 RepID=A0AAD6X3S5_9AGAR|nr:hypothetical protein C8F04DRAFT_1097874 [Mycena alexandri]